LFFLDPDTSAVAARFVLPGICSRPGLAPGRLDHSNNQSEMEVRMADVNSSDPTPNETTNTTGNDDTNVNTTNSGDNFAVEGIGKYGDNPGGGDNQNPESTSQQGNTSGATPI